MLRHKEFHFLLRHHGAPQLRIAPSESEIEELHEDSTPEQSFHTRASESFQNDTFHTFEPTSNNVFPYINPSMNEVFFSWHFGIGRCCSYIWAYLNGGHFHSRIFFLLFLNIECSVKLFHAASL